MKNTQQELSYIRAYNHSTKKTLNDCYKSYSNYKLGAYMYHYKKANNLNVENTIRILSHSIPYFTMAYKFIENDIEYLQVETPNNSLKIRIF